VAEVLAHISDDKREVVEDMWTLAMKQTYRHPLWDDLPAGKEQWVNANVLTSLFTAYERGALMDWESPADKLIEQAIEEAQDA
jgi:hypothetical protein